MKSKTVKVLVVPAVGALFLAMTALGTSAFATDTVTPSPSASPTDSSSSDEADATVAAGTEGDVQSVLDGQLGDDGDVQAILGDLQIENNDLLGDDAQVDEVNNDNNAQDASFSEDITAANQAGENEDVAQLTQSASIVTSVTAPEVAAMTADDTEAHDLIAGTPTK